MLSLLFIAISRVTLSYDDEYYARSCLDTNNDDGLREAETETDDYGGGRGLLLHRRQVRARATECSREPSNLTTGTNYSSDRELTTVAAPATTQSASCAEADGHDNGEQLRLQRQLRRPRQELARHGGHGLPAHNERRFEPLHAGSELREYHRRADEAAEINGGCSNIYATRSKRCTPETEFECAQLLNTDSELWGAIVAGRVRGVRGGAAKYHDHDRGDGLLFRARCEVAVQRGRDRGRRARRVCY